MRTRKNCVCIMNNVLESTEGKHAEKYGESRREQS